MALTPEDEERIRSQVRAELEAEARIRADVRAEMAPRSQFEPTPFTRQRPSFFMGMAVCATMAFLLVGAGAILSLTGIGAILGVPMIFVGCCAFLLSPFGKWLVLTSVGDCPGCGNRLDVSIAYHATTCRACKRRILLKQNHFHVA